MLVYSVEPIISADFLHFGVLNVFVDVEAPSNYKYVFSYEEHITILLQATDIYLLVYYRVV